MPRSAMILALGALAALGGLALDGCGGGGHAGTPGKSPAAVDASAYAAAGNAVCAGQLARLESLEHPNSPAQMVADLPPVLSIMHEETARLVVLSAPPDQAAQLTGALTGTKALIELLERFLQQLKSGMVEFSSLTSLQARASALRAEVDAHYRAAGLPRCAD